MGATQTLQHGAPLREGFETAQDDTVLLVGDIIRLGESRGSDHEGRPLGSPWRSVVLQERDRVMGDDTLDPANAYPEVQMRIVRRCAEEVHRQDDGPMQVWSMVDAWEWWRGLRMGVADVTVRDIASLGTLVHPQQNSRGFRAHEIRVGGSLGAYHHEICVKVQRWINAIHGKDLFEYKPERTFDVGIHTSFSMATDPERQAAVAYFNFERIHPFADGNGRTGKILYNWRNGTPDKPVMPPNFFGCKNP
jgi:hypothetical protein